MNSQDFRSLQEAYMDVYDELDEGVADDIAARARTLSRQRKGQTPERKKMYQELASKAQARADVQNPMRSSIGRSRFERSQDEGPVINPESSTNSREAAAYSDSLFGGKHTYGKGSLPQRPGKLYKQVTSGVRELPPGHEMELFQSAGRMRTKKESYDVYDIILSHLLDEGYAETPEAAEVIMVNMSEEWREDIMERTFRHGR